MILWVFGGVLLLAQSLNTYFTDHLHASVVSLQIQSCRLPLEFNDAITDTVRTDEHRFCSTLLTVFRDLRKRSVLKTRRTSINVCCCVLPFALLGGVAAAATTRAQVTQRQNITSAAKYLDQQTVTLQTNLLVAGKQANATVRLSKAKQASFSVLGCLSLCCCSNGIVRRG